MEKKDEHFERKIGEVFEFFGERYKVVEDILDTCSCCAFYRRRDKTCDLFRESIIGNCSRLSRKDKTPIFFKKVDPPTSEVASKNSTFKRRKLLLIYLK